MASIVSAEQNSVSNSNSLILKTDTRGHVRTPLERRETLLTQFERSGLSGKQFARLSRVKDSTFQYWPQCRKGRSEGLKAVTSGPRPEVPWLEAVVQQAMPSGVGDQCFFKPSPVAIQQRPQNRAKQLGALGFVSFCLVQKMLHSFACLVAEKHDECPSPSRFAACTRCLWKPGLGRIICDPTNSLPIAQSTRPR